jgi:hypothetical protein
MIAVVVAPTHVPAAQRPGLEAAVHAIGSGPLGVTYSAGFLLCGAAGPLAAMLTVVAVLARSDETLLDLEALDE